MRWLAFLALLSCHGEQEIHSPCVDEPLRSDEEACPACSSDDECVIISNTCHETATCAPAAGNFTVNSIGCSDALAYDRPPDSACVCRDAVCRAQED